MVWRCHDDVVCCVFVGVLCGDGEELDGYGAEGWRGEESIRRLSELDWEVEG